MQVHQFFGKYANVPLQDRMKPLNFRELGLMTLQDVYTAVRELEDEMRPKVIERDRLIGLTEQYILDHQALAPKTKDGK